MTTSFPKSRRARLPSSPNKHGVNDGHTVADSSLSVVYLLESIGFNNDHGIGIDRHATINDTAGSVEHLHALWNYGGPYRSELYLSILVSSPPTIDHPPKRLMRLELISCHLTTRISVSLRRLRSRPIHPSVRLRCTCTRQRTQLLVL